MAGGEHIEKVRDRLGHTSIVTTQKYLHSLPNADDSAIEALARVRGRRGPRPA
jgi:integrase